MNGTSSKKAPPAPTAGRCAWVGRHAMVIWPEGGRMGVYLYREDAGCHYLRKLGTDPDTGADRPTEVEYSVARGSLICTCHHARQFPLRNGCKHARALRAAYLKRPAEYAPPRPAPEPGTCRGCDGAGLVCDPDNGVGGACEVCGGTGLVEGGAA